MELAPVSNASVPDVEAAKFRRKKCHDDQLADVINFLKTENPHYRFNDEARNELAHLIFNLNEDQPFVYSVGQSHTLRKTIRDKLVNAGLMNWDRGHRVDGVTFKLSVATPTPLFFAVVNRHCQLKQGKGHGGYYNDPITMNQLSEFNAFMAQHTFTHAHGEIDPTHRMNYIPSKDGKEVIRQRLICAIHNKKKELRPTITIDGMPTARFDVTATHPQLLLHKYAKTHMAFDPYDIATDHEYRDELRTAAKLATMMMFNNSSRKSAATAFRKVLAKTDNREIRVAVAHFTGKQIEILDKVYDRNPHLRPYFYQERHRELMHMDGNIAWECMRRLADLGIPSLSVHDEFIVPSEYLNLALQMYKQCWIEETGIEGLGIEPIIIIK